MSNSLKLFKDNYRYIIGVVFVLLFAFIGVKLLSQSGASSPPLYSKMIGLNGTYSDSGHDYVQDAKNMNVQWMRIETWGDNANYETTCTSKLITQNACGVPAAFTNLANHGIHPWIMVNDYGTSWVQDGNCVDSNNTLVSNYTGTCTGKAAWIQAAIHAATTYAKGGTFWNGKTDLGSPTIEIANEPYGAWYKWPDSGWLFPGEYAKMVKEAAIAVSTATNGRIKLTAAATGDYQNSAGQWRHWSSDMLAAVPDLENYIAGVVIHPYGDIPSIDDSNTPTPSTFGRFTGCYGPTSGQSGICSLGAGTSITQSGNVITGHGVNFADQKYSDYLGNNGWSLNGSTIYYADGSTGIVEYSSPTTLISTVSKNIITPETYNNSYDDANYSHQSLYTIHATPIHLYM